MDIKPRNESSESPASGWKERVIANLAVYMNGYRVGTFTKTTSGAHQFQYHESWLAINRAAVRFTLHAILRHQAYRGDEAYNFSTTCCQIIRR